MQKTLHFQSTVSVFLIYLILKAAPLVAVVYYFSDWSIATPVAIVLLLTILIYSALTNHDFSIEHQQLTIVPSIFFWKKAIYVPYATIEQIEIKYAHERDNRQWLTIFSNDKTGQLQAKKYRCDWLHMQDPPDEDDDDHGHPEHELFELLENEDFYQGSLEQLAHELTIKGVTIKTVF
ncbi:hypothetical protein [Aureispira anguillae]|uniref:Uncharacterized protein n=1 Tax=Aureispira anguillae TaxID=2864201 RepID=A0A915YKC8_9BACT|nr:hypothetical protein [Aureispira anguillae]BDS14803.1 hypothetical protein AsAng_0055850 [Aureispira anguillae]